VCFSFWCESDIREYHQLPALEWFNSLENRALPTERVLTDSPFLCSSRACLGLCDRLSSACPGVTVICCLVSCFSRVGGGLEGLLLIVFAFRLRSLPSALVVSFVFLPVVLFLGVLGGAQAYACLQ